MNPNEITWTENERQLLLALWTHVRNTYNQIMMMDVSFQHRIGPRKLALISKTGTQVSVVDDRYVVDTTEQTQSFSASDPDSFESICGLLL